jgi:HEAT repeat protein
MPRPGKDAVAVMKSVLEKEPYNPRALYALGTYSRRFRDEGNSEMAVGLGEYLVEKLREATGPSGRLTALRAIGNSGYSAALPDVRGFTSDKDETTRVVAVRALQSMKDLAVDEILTSTMGSDTSFEVRISAIEAARVRDPTDKLLLAVVAACRHPEPRIRYRAVETLIRWLPRRPSLRPVLQKISQEDPEQRVRDLARSG